MAMGRIQLRAWRLRQARRCPVFLARFALAFASFKDASKITPFMQAKIDFIGITTGISAILKISSPLPPCFISRRTKQKQSCKDGNKFSLGTPTPKRPKVGMSYWKRRTRRQEAVGPKAPECAIAAGRWVGRQTRWLLSVLTKRGIEQHENRSIYTNFTNICTTSSHAELQMRRNLNERVPRSQE